MPGSGSGPQRPIGGDTDRALRVDFHYGPFRQWISDTIRAGHAKPCTCPPTVRSLDPATRDRINRVKPRITR